MVAFYNGRGTAEQWIKERKNAVKWTRLSCTTFRANAVRVQLHALAYNLANFLRTLALPGEVERWSLTTLREKVVKIGAKVVAHGRYLVFQMAEVAVPRELFGRILDRKLTLHANRDTTEWNKNMHMRKYGMLTLRGLRLLPFFLMLLVFAPHGVQANGGNLAAEPPPDISVLIPELQSPDLRTRREAALIETKGPVGPGREPRPRGIHGALPDFCTDV